MRQKNREKMRDLRHKGIYIIPNLFTSGNIFCGVFSLISAFHGEYLTAAIAILVASIFDMLDGKLARLTNTTSKFGVEYDSLSDLVSFGVAPGLLAYSWALQDYGRVGWMALFLFIVCGALRLARYNIQVSGPENNDFIGLPTPAAAILIASMILFEGHVMAFSEQVRPILMLSLTYLLAFLMVSNLRYRSFKTLNLRDRKPFNVLVGLVLVFMILITMPVMMLFSISAFYVLLGIIERPLVILYRKLDETPSSNHTSAKSSGIKLEGRDALHKH